MIQAMSSPRRRRRTCRPSRRPGRWRRTPRSRARPARRRAGEDERERDGGPRLLLGDLAGEHEDAGADDDTDPEDGQLDGTELLAELVLGLLGVGDRLLDRLGPHEVQRVASRQRRARKWGEVEQHRLGRTRVLPGQTPRRISGGRALRRLSADVLSPRTLPRGARTTRHAGQSSERAHVRQGLHIDRSTGSLPSSLAHLAPLRAPPERTHMPLSVRHSHADESASSNRSDCLLRTAK